MPQGGSLERAIGSPERTNKEQRTMLIYTVTCEYEGDDPAAWRTYLAWLMEGHLAEVCAGGALEAWLLLPDRDADPAAAARPLARAVYRFASRAAFADYERDAAPRLRAEGLRRFPAAAGFRFSRELAAVAAVAGGSA